MNNNNEVRQISEEEIMKELTKEELQQTQVLNYKEVQKAIRFEKITSKKPAILVGIVGIICLLFGGSLQIASSLKPAPSNIQRRNVQHNVKVETQKMNCMKTSLNNPDGTNTIYNIIYTFENDKLVGETKEYNITATEGKEEGKKSIEQYIKDYESLLNDTTGYSVEISSTSNTTINAKVIIDYKKLDLTKLNELQQTKEFTKVDYNKNITYEKVKEDAVKQGFTIEYKK